LETVQDIILLQDMVSGR